MKILKFSLAILALLVSFSFISLMWLLFPVKNEKDLPHNLVSLNSSLGKKIFDEADAYIDYLTLSEKIEVQIYRSYCGVASGVSVLNSLGLKTNQNDFFKTTTKPYAYTFKVLFSGMTLAELGYYLNYYGVETSIYHANEFTLEELRQKLLVNLSSPDDYIVVNYQRSALGQEAVGHISPLVAFDKETDMALILDTASYKYPPTWVPLENLYTGMSMVDDSSKKERGFIEISVMHQPIVGLIN